MTLLTKAQRRLLADGNYEAARAMAEADRPKKPRTPIRRKKRSASERERIYGTEAHQDWLRAHGCLGCGRTGSDDHPHHLHHVRNGGKGRKADAATLVPLCCYCHQELHAKGPETFEHTHGAMLSYRTLRGWAEHYAKAWTKWCAEPQPLSAIVPQVHADLRKRSGGC